jgi:hypothetical protein
MNFSVLILSLLNCSKTMWSYDSLVDLQKRLAYSNPIQALFKPYSSPIQTQTKRILRIKFVLFLKPNSLIRLRGIRQLYIALATQR